MVARLAPAVVFVVLAWYLVQALTLPVGTAARPGAGFFPVAVGVFGAVVALVAIAQNFFGHRDARVDPTDERDTDAARRRVLSTTLALAGFCLVMPWVGYPVAASAFVTVMLTGLGGGWLGALATGIVSALASHYLFAVLLDVPLPRGPW